VAYSHRKDYATEAEVVGKRIFSNEITDSDRKDLKYKTNNAY
jgi:hypothetical protein